MNYELWGIVILILDVIAILSIFRSGYSTIGKVLWTLGVLILPLVGMILWFLIGERKSYA